MGMDAGERGEHFIMKKKIAMLLAAALCMGTFAGCGNSTSNNSSAADNNTTNNTAAATESSDVTASADNVKIDTLNVYFVPSRDPDEIVTATEPLANLMQTELAGLGYDIGEVKITVGTTFEAVGEALAAGTADVGFIPGGTYVLYDDGADVILTATRDGLNKDSDNPADWNDGQPTEGTDKQAVSYRALFIAGPSDKGQELADKGYVTDALVKHYEARAKGGVGLIVTEVTGTRRSMDTIGLSTTAIGIIGIVLCCA